jgi:hypothetical protein
LEDGGKRCGVRKNGGTLWRRTRPTPGCNAEEEEAYVDGWDYVSELRPPTRLLSITQAIHEYGRQQRNDTDRGKLMILPPKVSSNSTSTHLVAMQEEHGEGNAKFYLRSISFILVGFFNIP